MYNERTKKNMLKYAKEKIKRIPLDVQLSYHNDVLKPAAERANTPINTFIKEAIQARIDKENGKKTEEKTKE